MICHGLLVAGLITEIGGQIAWLASGMSFKFKKPVYIGDTIRCDFTVTEMDEKGCAKAEAVFTNDNQITVLEAALFRIVPGGQEKQVMENMIVEGAPTNKIFI